MKFGIQISLIALLASSSACTFIARSAEDYRDVTRELVSTKNGEIKDCYDVALQSDEGATGTVVVNFTVEKKTGTIMNPSLDESSTAQPELGQCVVQAVDGLVLEPPDQRDGVAKFTWEFVAG